MQFISELLKKILNNQHHNYTTNYDAARFTPVKPKKKIKQKVGNFLNRYGFFNIYKQNQEALISLKNLSPYLSEIEKVYDLVSDSLSKEVIVELTAYRLLGYKKVKLRTNNEKYHTTIRQIEGNKKSPVPLETGFRGYKLYHYHLNDLGFPVELYFTAKGIYIDYVSQQYQYSHGETVISADEGDYVIDAGACWGDTALYFASKVGKSGNVFSFEFINSNIDIFNTNIDLNPELKSRITLISHPLWDMSGTNMYYLDDGPASRVSFEKKANYNGTTKTVSIDDFVRQNNIQKIDLIKMDIEGAEPKALKGGIETIKKFKPKLAIAIYHSLDDFVNIPLWLNSLGLGYRFYIDHYTIHSEETVLYAKIF